ncbi:UNKNOWN [Stylonychia lemnae]|uniref:Uncharacterized protein n=1 Tax=Stylonychia lemnae TaxID=5949 RepID=A0A077ZVQ2_STYLE|nr:UNKNOWN [Stylonychia lemnae]|eukprot:CDW73954.1 UNKNOWN [Stylonychia lemnae]
MSMVECSDYEYKENLLIASPLAFIQGKPSDFNGHQGINNLHNMNPLQDSQNSLRLHGLHSSENNKDSELRKSNKSHKRNISKTSSDHSVITPNQKNFNMPGSTLSKNNTKKPLYSLIPGSINKNLNIKNPFHTSENKQTTQNSLRDYQSQPQQKALKSDNNDSEFIMSGQVTLSNAKNRNIASYSNLTPQKNLPTPISPTTRPDQLNGYNKQSSFPNKAYVFNYQNSEARGAQANHPTSLKNHCNNSGQKATVVYDEFKYYTSNVQMQNSNNPKKYIDISGCGIGLQRRSDNSGSHISNQNNLQFDLSPTEHKIFDLQSPKMSVNSQANGIHIKTNLGKPQAFYTDRGHNINNGVQNYCLQLKCEPSEDIQNITDSNAGPQPEAEKKIKELQEYIEHLENDLKMTQSKNHELKKKFKDRSFIQSFDKTKKHLSDTEDSLILSEKKGKKRSSLTKQGPNTSMQQIVSNQNTFSNNNHQSTSSIVDVKIRPIHNMKQGLQYNYSPQKKMRSSSSNSKYQDNSNKKLDNSQDDDMEEGLEYQVNNYNDFSGSQINSSQLDENRNGHNDSPTQNHQHLSEDECEGCERLKQLVFQAKEAIDDLKLEIEEWRDICSEKETELRQLQHKIYNDIMGQEKRIEFNDEVQTREFDGHKPVNQDSRKVRNFIQHNKKRIRSRSKNQKIESTCSTQKVSIAQSIKKKSVLKNVKDLVSDQFEFYEAEDIGIQTSFDLKISCHNTDNNLTNTSIDCDSNKNQNVQKDKSVESRQNQRVSPNNEMNKDINLMKISEETYQSNEEVYTLRTKTQIQEEEIKKLRQQVQLLSGQCEKFLGLATKAKKKQNKKSQQYDLENIKQNYDIISTIESYSILEKINEWKREEGLIDQNQYSEPQQTQIPRPLKLIQDIDMNEIIIYESSKRPESAINQNPLTGAQQIANTNANMAQEFLQLIKQEQENIKKQQEQKLRELQMQHHQHM